jgi:hypothetical protein
MGSIFGKTPRLGASSSEAVNKDEVEKRVCRTREDI